MTTGINQGKLGHREGDVIVALRNGTTDTPEALYSDAGKMHVLPYFWNPNSLAWEVSTGGTTPGGNVNVTNFPSSYPVTGSFLTDAQLRATPVPVSGTVSTTGLTDAELRATPVPMSVSGSVAVTGTFWQATQPVSIASMPSTPVTGTFWQATQPISGSVSVSNMVAQGLTDTELRASAVPVSLASVPSHAVTNAGTFAVQVTSAPTTAVTGTFWQATQPVSLAAAVALDAGTLAALETITVANFTDNGLTDAQLRATAVPVSQPAATDWRSDLRRGQTPLFAVVNASGSGDNTLVAADGTKKVKVLQYTLVSAGTVNATFKSGAATALSGAMPLVANSGIASPFVAPAQGHLIETAVNQALVLNLSGAIAVTGHITYILEA